MGLKVANPPGCSVMDPTIDAGVVTFASKVLVSRLALNEDNLLRLHS
jgi:hypothetical protein